MFGTPQGNRPPQRPGSDNSPDRKRPASETNRPQQTDRPKRPGPQEKRESSGNELEKLFEARDRNGDGKLTGDEIPPRAKENLERIDRNGDGSLDKEEMRRAFQRRAKQEADKKPETRKKGNKK